MTTEWIITTVALGLTALMSLSSIILPFIMNYKSNKLKLKEQSIGVLHQTINEFVTAYGEFRSNFAYCQHILSSIYKVMMLCSDQTKDKLRLLADQITSANRSYTYTDSSFYDCVTTLQKEFSITKILDK